MFPGDIMLWIGDTDSGDLVSISSSGEVLERLSVGVDGPVAVAEEDVVLGHSRDGLVALRGGETLWTRAGEFAKVDFVVADLDSDGEPELMVLTQDGWLEVLDVESGTVLGRLQHGRRGFEAAPVAFDLDDDGLLEVVLGSRDGFLAAYDGATLSR